MLVLFHGPVKNHCCECYHMASHTCTLILLFIFIRGAGRDKSAEKPAPKVEAEGMNNTVIIVLWMFIDI